MGVGHIVNLQHWITRVAPDKHVDAAAVLIGGVLGHLPAAARFRHVARQGREDALAADSRVQQAGDLQRRVPNDLSLEAPRRVAPQQAVEGILFV